MAVMTCDFYSTALKRNTTVNLIVPTPQGNEQITDEKVKEQYHYEKGLPVVYLLHGAYGNYASWMRFSNVERYAQKYGCVLVMPSAGNNFYQDMYRGDAYETYVARELPELVRTLFPVSRRREDTYVAGFSMGGYGAWYLALSHPEVFSKTASMSGALDLAQCYEQGKSGAIDSPFCWDAIFETPEALAGSAYDLYALCQRRKEEGNLPALYQAVGRQDFLYQMNREVYQKLRKEGIEVCYREDEGGHNWDFWDRYIQEILAWMFPEK